MDIDAAHLLATFETSERDIMKAEDICLENLISFYDSFWTKILETQLFQGSSAKIPNARSSPLKLEKVAQILRQCWENGRYFPEGLFRPFLEVCFLNIEDERFIQVEKDMFLEYISEEDKAALEGATDVTNCLDVLKKYCPGEDFSSFTVVEDAVKQAEKSFLRDMIRGKGKTATDVWIRELVGMLELEEFRYLMNHPCKIMMEDETEYDDLKEYLKVLPHKLWRTFFYKWSKDQVDFYFKLLKKRELNTSHCYRCNTKAVTTKHMVGSDNCDPMLSTMCLVRHDSVLRIIEKQLLKAMNTRTGEYFREGDDWVHLISYGNYQYDWPSELGQRHLYPDIVAYSMDKKEVVIIQVTISWECWIDPPCTIRRYLGIKNDLEDKGFHVEMTYIQPGARGVLFRHYKDPEGDKVTSDIYKLFTKSFGMSHQKAYKVMEKISREIISVAYNEWAYFQQKERDRQKREERRATNEQNGLTE